MVASALAEAIRKGEAMKAKLCNAILYTLIMLLPTGHHLTALLVLAAWFVYHVYWGKLSDQP